jgi:uncharacterized LabA/DUF88 family protein
MRISVYIDGFNLYYGSLKDKPGRWLDLYNFSKSLLPKEIYEPKVNYFSAPLVSRYSNKINDGQRRTRQQAYLRALEVAKNINIKLGFFLTHEVIMHTIDGKNVKVWKTEEKGTDVNIASTLINEGHNDIFDIAIVISNDSDLVEPIRIVTEELKKKVIVFNPFNKNSVELQKVATEHRKIRRWMIEKNQLPEVMQDENGEVKMPEGWN